MVSMPINPRARGFTLIELLVVLAIVALILTLALPRFFPRVDQTREAVLAENLRTVRAVIEQYHADTGTYPASLTQLVEQNYLRALPYDPVAESDSAWLLLAPPSGAAGALYDIRSGAAGADRHGKPYAQW